MARAKTLYTADPSERVQGPQIPAVYCGSQHKPAGAHGWHYVCLQEPHEDDVLCSAEVGGTVKWRKGDVAPPATPKPKRRGKAAWK